MDTPINDYVLLEAPPIGGASVSVTTVPFYQHQPVPFVELMRFVKWLIIVGQSWLRRGWTRTPRATTKRVMDLSQQKGGLK
jgi:hypothetical protein